MISISKLYCGAAGESDWLRYGDAEAKMPRQVHLPARRKPVVVWNCTRRCNLACLHCYSGSTKTPSEAELSNRQAKTMIDDLVRFGVPVILFSGGEPLLRPDVPELIAHAHQAGIRTVLSTNGTLITPALAERLASSGLNYVGVSLDGLKEVNDAFRGVDGAFELALAGIRASRQAGLKVGLRLTMHRRNLSQIPAIFDLIEGQDIRRACFYHLVFTGRGENLRDEGLTHAQTRAAVGLIMDRTAALHAAGRDLEVLTVDNHADGPYVYLRLLRENPARAEQCLKLLEITGGNSSGVGIGCVSWNGDVLPDQFWRQQVLGNVRQRAFSEIWSDPDQPILAKLRDRKQYLKGRCARCRWGELCNGNFRARAQALTGDPWAEDPACYLTDEEIG